jgi:hypothetical protein
LRQRAAGHGSSDDDNPRRPHVQIDKNQILELLRSQGNHDQAQQAQDELPDTVDTDQHAGLLQKFGLNPQDLVAKFLGGGGGGGGLGGELGGLLGR